MSSAITSGARGSADFGATVRAVLLAPGSGFVPALKRAETTSEGSSTYVLAALGGAAAMVLWLKVRGLLGFRKFTAAEFDWGLFTGALALGAAVAVLAQVLWSFAAPRAGGADAGSPRSFRAVWALSAFPQLVTLLVLLPLDVLFVGGRAFTTDSGGDSVTAAWIAISTALSVSLGVWSAYVFAQGVHAATRASAGVSATTALLGPVCAAAVLAVLFLGLAALAGAAG
jgi:hypothetical protein